MLHNLEQPNTRNIWEIFKQLIDHSGKSLLTLGNMCEWLMVGMSITSQLLTFNSWISHGMFCTRCASIEKYFCWQKFPSYHILTLNIKVSNFFFFKWILDPRSIPIESYHFFFIKLILYNRHWVLWMLVAWCHGSMLTMFWANYLAKLPNDQWNKESDYQQMWFQFQDPFSNRYLMRIWPG